MWIMGFDPIPSFGWPPRQESSNEGMEKKEIVALRHQNVACEWFPQAVHWDVSKSWW